MGGEIRGSCERAADAAMKNVCVWPHELGGAIGNSCECAAKAAMLNVCV